MRRIRGVDISLPVVYGLAFLAGCISEHSGGEAGGCFLVMMGVWLGFAS